MATEDQEPRTVAVRGFLAGLVVGLVCGLLAVIVPVMGFVLLVAGVVAALVSAWGNPVARMRGLSTTAGFFIAMGGLFLWGSWNTISACAQTDDFCGDANVVPLARSRCRIARRRPRDRGRCGPRPYAETRTHIDAEPPSGSALEQQRIEPARQADPPDHHPDRQKRSRDVRRGR